MSTSAPSKRLANERTCKVCGRRYNQLGIASHVRACERRAKARKAKEASGTVVMTADHQYRPWIISAYDYTCVGRGLGTSATGESHEVSLLGFAETMTPYHVSLTVGEWLTGQTGPLSQVIGMYPVVIRRGRLYTEHDAIIAVLDHRPTINLPAALKRASRVAVYRDVDKWEDEGRRLILLSGVDDGAVEEQFAFLGAMRLRIRRAIAAASEIAGDCGAVNVTVPPNATVRTSVQKTSGAER